MILIFKAPLIQRREIISPVNEICIFQGILRFSRYLKNNCLCRRWVFPPILACFRREAPNFLDSKIDLQNMGPPEFPRWGVPLGLRGGGDLKKIRGSLGRVQPFFLGISFSCLAAGSPPPCVALADTQTILPLFRKSSPPINLHCLKASHA